LHHSPAPLQSWTAVPSLAPPQLEFAVPVHWVWPGVQAALHTPAVTDPFVQLVPSALQVCGVVPLQPFAAGVQIAPQAPTVIVPPFQPVPVELHVSGVEPVQPDAPGVQTAPQVPPVIVPFTHWPFWAHWRGVVPTHPEAPGLHWPHDPPDSQTGVVDAHTAHTPPSPPQAALVFPVVHCGPPVALELQQPPLHVAEVQALEHWCRALSQAW
jgi:hypothetical protein